MSSTAPYDFDAAEGIYARCHATSGMGHWSGGPPYCQAITVYVTD